MHKIKVGNDILFANDGEPLFEVLTKSNIKTEHPCGGNGTCGKCKVLVDGREELSCQYKVTHDITVTLLENGEILSETGAKETDTLTENMCYVLDIGTTTLALALVSLDDNKIIKVVTKTNPQRTYGADIMSRIKYCTDNGVNTLHSVIIDAITEMVGTFGLDNDLKMYVSGNVTMLHILFNVDCESIGVYPYSATFLDKKIEKLPIKGVCEAESLPSIHSFVGADLVAGLNYVGMPHDDKYNLLIDLGTNAEIVLYSKDHSICTAAAAGPCFEGANISCGMSATNGAIYEFEYKNGSDIYKTIGDVPPKGFCGTGLVDVMAELVKNEEIDETGFLECEKYFVTDEIFISDKDVRQFQLAKSAIYSAILALMDVEGIGFEQIENMYISGGFSAKINIQNAVDVGILPKELIGKCVAINNSSLLGTVKYATEQNDLCVYTQNAGYIDLSANAKFTDLFVENMMFN